MNEWRIHENHRNRFGPGGTMKLVDLNPSYASGGGKRFLILDCPKCQRHGIAVQIEGEGKYIWKQSGYSFEDLTLTPSIVEKAVDIEAERKRLFISGSDHRGNFWLCHFHFFIENGEIKSPFQESQ